jgi:hypothetical protein
LEFDEEVLKYYQQFLITSFQEDEEGFFNNLESFIQFCKKPLIYDREVMWKYMLLATSPLRSNDYHWGETNLPDQLMKLGKNLRKSLKFKSVPDQFIFLDRKVMGVFSLVKKLNARFDVKSIFEKYI